MSRDKVPPEFIEVMLAGLCQQHLDRKSPFPPLDDSVTEGDLLFIDLLCRAYLDLLDLAVETRLKGRQPDTLGVRAGRAGNQIAFAGMPPSKVVDALAAQYPGLSEDTIRQAMKRLRRGSKTTRN